MNCVVCAIAKNENHYLREWVEHYKNIGFAGIYLFDNNEKNGEKIEDVIGDYIDSGYVILDKYYRGKNDKLYQIPAYKKFYTANNAKFDWCLFVDIDEFLEFEYANDINSFLSSNEKFSDYDIIRFCWKCYTDNNLVTVTDGNYSVKRFTEVSEYESNQCKSLIRGSKKFSKFNCHGIWDIETACDAMGNPCKNGKGNDVCVIGNEKVWNGAWLNHYRFKTIQEFIDTKLKNWKWNETVLSYINFDTFFKINAPTKEKLDYMNEYLRKDEDIVVSFTSWKNRIGYVKHSFELMLNQTKLPKKIILNLSTDEFPKKEKELPSDLITYIKEHKDICSINWVKENSKVFKKFLPILKKYKDCVIVTMDDDIEYPNDYIEMAYREYKRWGGLQPITFYKNERDFGLITHSGPFTITKYDFYGDYIEDLYKNLVLKHPEMHWSDDEIYSYAAWLNGTRYRSVPDAKFRELYNDSIKNAPCAYSDYGRGFMDRLIMERSVIEDYIKTKYNKTLLELLNAEINVNVTTWKKRDWVLHTMLESIKNQSVKPTRVILWLSKDEYGGVLNDNIKKCVDDGLITNIEWVDGNTYSHKRWECMRRYPWCYNIMTDDDIYYQPNHIKELMEVSVLNQGSATVWCSLHEVYRGTRRLYMYNPVNSGMDLQTLSGLSCYAPFSYPVESFNYSLLRDRWCKKCDDSWNRAWLIKNGIRIARVFDRRNKVWKQIDGTMDVGIWETENKNYTNGIENITKNFANAIKCARCEDAAKTIWRDFDIDGCATYNENSCCDEKSVCIDARTGKSNVTMVVPKVITNRHDALIKAYIADNKIMSKSRTIHRAINDTFRAEIIDAPFRTYANFYKKVISLSDSSEFVLLIKSNVCFDRMDELSFRQLLNRIKEMANDESLGVWSSSIYTASIPLQSSYKGTGRLREVPVVSDQFVLIRSSIFKDMNMNFFGCNSGAGFIDYVCKKSNAMGYINYVDDKFPVHLYTNVENDRNTIYKEEKNRFLKNNPL